MGFIGLIGGHADAADGCGGIYEIARGDSLSLIADRLYKDAREWRGIYEDNRDTIGADPDKILVGNRLDLACRGGLPTGLKPQQKATAPVDHDLHETEGALTSALPAVSPAIVDPVLEPDRIRVVTDDHQAPFADAALLAGGLEAAVLGRADVQFLVGSDAPPFAQVDWPGQGMITELVERAWALSPEPEPHDRTWNTNRAAILEEIRGGTADLSFPWSRPTCPREPADSLACTSVHFSDPIIDLAILLFVRTSHEVPFATEDDLRGLLVCLPSDGFADRTTSSVMMTVLSLETIPDCFEALMTGEVDAVAVDEFSGVRQLFEMGLTDAVVPLPRPLGSQSLHVVASKTHWRATALIYRFNTGLARLRQTTAYSEIIARHIDTYWVRLKP